MIVLEALTVQSKRSRITLVKELDRNPDLEPRFKEYSIGERVEYYRGRKGYLEDNTDGKTIEQLAQEAGPDVLWVQTHKTLDATIIVQDKELEIGHYFGYSGKIYLDAQVYQVSDLKLLQRFKLRIDGTIDKDVHTVVRMKNGYWMFFEEGDRVMTSVHKTKTSILTPNS